MSREPLTDMHPFGREFWLGDNGPGYKWGPIICLTRAELTG